MPAFTPYNTSWFFAQQGTGAPPEQTPSAPRFLHPDAKNRRADHSFRRGQYLPFAFGVKIAYFAVRRMRSARTEQE
jgi:hypothetical protein